MRLLRAIACLLLCVPAAGAVEWVPVGGLSVLGGVHSYAGESGSLSGNASASFSPAMRLSPRWSVLPSAHAEYEGTRRVDDVLGTMTPAAERLGGRLGIRAVWANPSSRWRLKPTVSYGRELSKETKDESWGKGLYDQIRWAVGGEVELLTREPHSLRMAVDWFESVYPNYTTLESQAALQFAGQPLARELVGDRVLDRRGWQFRLIGDAPLGSRAVGEASLTGVWSRFAAQRLIDEGGQFQDRAREDFLTRASFALRMPHEWNADLRARAGVEVAVTANTSNQNGYDATRGRFLPGFYDFVEWRLEPSVIFVIGPPRRPVSAALKLGRRQRHYTSRPAQNETGAYGSGSLTTTEWSFGTSLDYPMAKRLSLLFSLERTSASSNQGYQRYYRYAYEATTALAGFRWDW
ncbi:MAG: hypothetical protein A2506_07725 [Elusimicrobia bacterium RIFOXYD12_FULL_66_9]|nr:MAG: hypothetical protein A2506_07725 [Elusimicrobia bacterium RIFOXYD12_FULL_66_9]